jgi:hypothetical protein
MNLSSMASRFRIDEQQLARQKINLQNSGYAITLKTDMNLKEQNWLNLACHFMKFELT